MSNKGYIYIAFNPEMPKCVKVGLTTREPQKRLAELSGTSTPVPFRLLMKWHVTDVNLAENAAHEALTDQRVAPNREFFRIECSDAISVVGKAIKPYLIYETEPTIRDQIIKACDQVAQFYLTHDYRTEPVSNVSPEIAEALKIKIRERVLWLAQWATDEGANPLAIVSVIDLVSANLEGPPQFRLSPEQMVEDFLKGVDMYMSLLHTSFYLQCGIEAYAPPVLQFIANVSQIIAQAMRLEEDDPN